MNLDVYRKKAKSQQALKLGFSMNFIEKAP